MKVEHYQTRISSKKSKLKMELTQGRPYQIYTIYSLKIPKLRRGDIIQCHAQLEVVMPKKLIKRSINIMVGYTMIIHDKKIILHGETVNLTDLGEFLYPCFPATQDMSHNIPIVFATLIGSKQVKKDGDLWISLVSYSASSKSKSGDNVNVSKNYGGLVALVNRI